MSRDDARREARRAVEATGLTRSAFADQAGIDVGTLSDFLDGKRWPQAPKRRKIEERLGWPAGRISDLADGAAPVTPDGEDAAFVADRGRDDVAPGITDDELLAEIRRVRTAFDEQLDQLERRLRDRSVGGAE